MELLNASSVRSLFSSPPVYIPHSSQRNSFKHRLDYVAHWSKTLHLLPSTLCKVLAHHNLQGPDHLSPLTLVHGEMHDPCLLLRGSILGD